MKISTRWLLAILIVLMLIDISLRLVSLLTPTPSNSALLPNSITPRPNTVRIAFQCYERGYMIWRSDTGTIYALAGRDGGQAYIVNDYVDLPEIVGIPAPSGLFLPTSGFGRVWAHSPVIRAGLGWATEPEHAYESVITTYASRVHMVVPGGVMDISYRGYFTFSTNTQPECA